MARKNSSSRQRFAQQQKKALRKEKQQQQQQQQPPAQEPAIELNSSHLATMCGPFTVPNGHKLIRERNSNFSQQVLTPLYGSFIKINSNLVSLPGHVASKNKLLVSLMSSMDIINGITPPTSLSTGDDDSDMESIEEKDIELEIIGRAIELPQVTIENDTNYFKKELLLSSTGLDDPFPEHIVQSLASFFN